MKQIMVVGAGSVGGYFGAQLAKSNPNVSFLLRHRTLEAVKQRGLTIRSAKGTFTVHPPAASDPRQLPAPDLVILGVKAYDLDEVMAQLEPVLTDKTIILTLQNGIDTEDRILARLQRDCVVGGVAFIYSKIVEPGVIDHYKRVVAIGELMGHQSDRLLRIAEVFKQAGVSVRSATISGRASGRNVLELRLQPGHRVDRRQGREGVGQSRDDMRIRQIVGEVAAISAALKVPLAPDMAEKVEVTQEIRDIHTSMYDDWKAKRPTEIDGLNGYIVRMGRQLGIPTPVNEALTAMIKAVTEKEVSGPGVVRIDGAVVQPVSLTRAVFGAAAEGTAGRGYRRRHAG
ncbi:MAG: 2-dehydropantoate 2-reductase [Nitrospiraceae bacterium]